MYYAQCVVLDKGILIAGSCGNKSSHILEKGKWEMFIEMPFTPYVYVHAVVLSDNLLFAFNKCDIFTLKIGGNKWEKLNIKSKVEYRGHRIVEENGFIFITYKKRWDVFDAVKKEWVFTGDDILPFPMENHGFLFLKSLSKPPICRFLIWGGRDAGNKACVLSYDLANPLQKPTFEVCEAPKKWSEKTSSFAHFRMFFYSLFHHFHYFLQKKRSMDTHSPWEDTMV